MESLEEIIQSITLPYEIPKEVFAFTPEGKAPDVMLVICELPPVLRELIDLDFTAINKLRGGGIVYWLPLLIGGTLRITLEHHAITEFSLEP